ncbi:uncharacterized protein EV420DRAFT_1643217 [Desarmillaria tabescens]|uniref:Uncharacterized protein n=1 Tax=Armillaria tabescens TaxID=1929756 RepID=A0AA39N568_ARMTA|nr:uncharacterized protein EV420DRAFT_1643217 [Desarmillaria tabescens]KAK0458327.1 hypothetical protein EV420DRAFT_1643217 [Desarmillaria tabescens]
MFPSSSGPGQRPSVAPDGFWFPAPSVPSPSCLPHVLQLSLGSSTSASSNLSFQHSHRSWPNLYPPVVPPPSFPGHAAPSMPSPFPSSSFVMSSSFSPFLQPSLSTPNLNPYPSSVPSNISQHQRPSIHTQQQQQQNASNSNNPFLNLQNNSQPIHNTYNYFTYSSPSSSVSTPSTTSIPELTGRTTWGLWVHGIKSLADINGVLPHIIEEPMPGVVVINPMCRPSYPPVLSPDPSPQEWDTFVAWHRKDAVMIHILTSRLSADVSAVLPMVDDHGGAEREFTVRTLLGILRKHFGLGQPVQAHAAREALRTYTVDMRNVSRFIQRWRSTILSLRAEQYPIIYFDVALNLVKNLPKDGGWYLPIRQEVTRDCGQAADAIDFAYFDSLMDRVLDLDTQWRLSKPSSRTLRKKCDICGQQSHTTEQHDPSKQKANDISSTGLSSSPCKSQTSRQVLFYSASKLHRYDCRTDYL